MSDAWNEIQAVKSKRNSMREKLEKRKKERQDILGVSSMPTAKSESSLQIIEDKKINIISLDIGKCAYACLSIQSIFMVLTVY